MVGDTFLTTSVALMTASLTKLSPSSQNTASTASYICRLYSLCTCSTSALYISAIRAFSLCH